MKIPTFLAILAFACSASIALAETAVGGRYTVQVRPDDNAQWVHCGVWVFGGRADEHPIEIRVHSGNAGKDVVGQVKYKQQEGMLGVNLRRLDGRLYSSETKRGNDDHVDEGAWVIGTEDQTVKQLHATSDNAGKTLTGTITFEGGEAQQFLARQATSAQYRVEIRPHRDADNQEQPDWEDHGIWSMGGPAGELPILIHLIRGGGGDSVLGGRVQFADQAPQPLFLNHIAGQQYQSKAMSASPGAADVGEWSLSEKALTQVYAVSKDGGNTLTGYVAYSGSPVHHDLRATLVETEMGAEHQSMPSSMPSADDVDHAAWDGDYVNDNIVLTISENGSKLAIKDGSGTMTADIVSHGTTFEGFIHPQSPNEQSIPISGSYGEKSVSLSVAGGQAMVHTAIDPKSDVDAE